MSKDNKLPVNIVYENDVETASEPKIETKVELVPAPQTPELDEAFASFNRKMHEAIAVPAGKWPEGRTLELTLGFQLVPSVKAQFSQK